MVVRKDAKTTQCSCKHNGLLCTDMCQCLDCSNCPTEPDDGVRVCLQVTVMIVI